MKTHSKPVAPADGAIAQIKLKRSELKEIRIKRDGCEDLSGPEVLGKARQCVNWPAVMAARMLGV